MPKSLSVVSALEASRLSSDVPFLCLLDIEVINPVSGAPVQILRIVRSPENLTWRGNDYQAGIFDISIKQEAGKSAEVNLSVNDYTQSIQAYMEAYGGGVGSNVIFTVVNADDLEGEPEAQEFFQIIAANSSEYGQQFTLGADNALLQVFPRRRQTKDFCQYRYKDPSTCKYAGPMATCDLTLQGPNGCAAHSNTINFGGFPGINSNGMRYA